MLHLYINQQYPLTTSLNSCGCGLLLRMIYGWWSYLDQKCRSFRKLFNEFFNICGRCTISPCFRDCINMSRALNLLTLKSGGRISVTAPKTVYLSIFMKFMTFSTCTLFQVYEFRNSFLKLKEWENECHLISLNSYCQGHFSKGSDLFHQGASICTCPLRGLLHW